MYGERVLEHFRHPRNVGELPAPAISVEVSNPACGDVLRLSARIDAGRVAEARFRCQGCTASVAAGSVLTGLVQGKTREELASLTAAAVEQALDGLSAESRHASVLAADAARALAARLS